MILVKKTATVFYYNKELHDDNEFQLIHKVLIYSCQWKSNLEYV